MFERMLYPTDFSELSEKALPYVLTLKEAGAHTIILLHVIDSSTLDAMTHYSPIDLLETRKRLRDMAAQKIEALAAQFESAGFSVAVRIEEGIPFREILRVEQEEQVTSIVMASHGSSNIKEMLLGSVSEQVIRKARTPVIVIKR